MNPQNLKPFKKGQSGNPKGSTKNRRYLKELQELLIEKLGAEDDKKGDIEEIIEKLISLGKKGDLAAIKEILERAYGKTKNTEEHTGEITIKVVYGKKRSNGNLT